MAEETDFIGLISSFLGPTSSNDGVAADGAPTRLSSADPVSLKDDDIDHPPSTRVIIFSKDRPWQLLQLVRSMRLPTGNASINCDDITFLQYVEIYIICNATTSEFADGYEQVRQTYQQADTPFKLCFLYEGDWIGKDDSVSMLIRDNMECNSFSYLLGHALNSGADDAPSFVMFLTDDCLFLDSLEVALAHAIGSLRYEQNECVYNFSTRLHPAISKSQTRDCCSSSPRDWRYHSLVPYLNNVVSVGAHGSNKINHGVYLYTTKSGSIEWNYPFDLSGGVYQYGDVLTILQQIKTKDEDCEDNQDGGLAHPNTFEVRGNQAVLEIENELVASRKTLSAVPSRPLMVILAVNRVQDVCRAPIARSGEGRVTVSNITSEQSLIDDPTDPSALLKLLHDGQNLDLERYLSTPYNSSHIGDLFLSKENRYLESSVMQRTPHDVSVLIPVHSGVDFASHSITSIIMQCVEELPFEDNTQGSQTSLSSMQIVIVDDRCVDGSIDVMIQTCKELIASYPKICLVVLDQRFRNAALDQKQQQHEQSTISITIDIVPSKSPGVASALNTGLEHCKSEFVARMDADDVSAPKRLITQLRFMRDNPTTNVVGASAVIFSSRDDQNESTCPLPYHSVVPNSEQSHIIRTSLTISDPGFMSWAMLFTCCIAHPSVMFRKSAVEEVGRYDESIKYAEDYDLWLRLLEKDCRSILCLPLVGVYHRKHNHSNSVANSLAQKKEANNTCHRATKLLLSFEDDGNGQVLDIEHISTLKDPATASSLDSINDASRLLVNMEASFLRKNANCLTGHEVQLIHNDCDARIGELATIAISKFGHDNSNHFKFNGSEEPCFVWRLWCDRCPNEQFQRLSLLCHLTTTS